MTLPVCKACGNFMHPEGSEFSECDNCDGILHHECLVQCEECRERHCPECQIGSWCNGCRDDLRYSEYRRGYLRPV